MVSAQGLHVAAIEAQFLQLVVETELIGDPVHEQHTVEMVHLMQDAARHQAISFAALGPAQFIAVFDIHLAGTHHIEVNPRNAEAALLVGVEGATGGYQKNYVKIELNST